ncbi:MAG: hypothetical protein DCC65_04505 [Planctomycetota bacterium]|nr:MAG: hypothetical protein DCC65_04505 [Planctomycetota bacterium]
MGTGINVTPEPVRANRRLLFALAPLFGLTLVAGLLSDGVYHDDDLTHFLVARWSRWFPSYLLHIWGRPGLTVPLASVAGAEDVETAWRAARVLSAMVTAAAALLTGRLALRLGLARPQLAVLFAYAQPLVAVLALTTLTENFAALYLVSAVFLLQSRRPVSASLVFSLIFVTRHEAVILWPVWLAGLYAARTRPRRWLLPALCSVWAPLVHNALFFAVFRRWPVAIFTRPHGSTEYPAGGPLAYIPDALYALTPALLSLAIVGGAWFIRRRMPLIPALAGVFLLAHIVVKAIGVFASGGYGRFLVTVFPLVAILALAGWNEIDRRVREGLSCRVIWLVFAGVCALGWLALEEQNHAGRFHFSERTLWLLRGGAAALIALAVGLIAAARAQAARAGLLILALTCAGQWCAIFRPLGERDDQRTVRDACQWLMQSPYAAGPVFGTNPWFALYLDLIEHPRAHKGAALLASLPVGTIFFWDSKYSANDFHRLPRDSFAGDAAHYETVRIIRSHGREPLELWVFRKIAETPQPDAAEPPYPPDLAAEESPVRGIYYLRGKRAEAARPPIMR